MLRLALLTRITLLGALATASGGGYAIADLITVDLGKSLQQTQTDAAGDMSNTVDYFAARAFYQNAGDFDGGTLMWSGCMSPQPMTDTPGDYYFLNNPVPAAGYFIYQTGSYSSQSTLDADFPMGAYTYNLTSGTMTTPPASSTIGYAADLYPANTPVLTAASFTALQNLDATQSADVGFSPLLNNAAFDSSTDSSFVFLDVFNASTNTDVYSTFSSTPAGLMDLTLPAYTLAPGTSYYLVLDFDNRIAGTDANGVAQFQLFDNKTVVNFTTASSVATPEPAGFALSALGILLILGPAYFMRVRSGR